jgi:hypothetical protein
MVRLGIRAAKVGLAGVAAALVSACAPEGPQFTRLDGVPDLNGLWQANGTANWNLEAHSAVAMPGFPGLGAIAAIPAGISYVEGGTIPYLPEALAQRDANRAGWPATDPEAKCYMPGIPRATYMPYPFYIVQGNKDMLFAYEFATANRKVNILVPAEPLQEGVEPTWVEPPEKAVVPTWMGTSNGYWDGDTLVVEVTGNNEQAWYDRAGNYRSTETVVTERFTKVSDDRIDYSATIEDPTLYSRPWTIRLPLYRRTEAGAQMLEFKCVLFSEELIYGHLTKANQPQQSEAAE